MLHAILVGINKYKDPNIRDLSFARNDAEVFGKLLEERIHPSERKIRLLLDQDATKRKIMTSIGEDLPRSVGKDDVVLLYFSGHGSPETDGSPDEISRYLITHDTEYENIYATGIDMERELPRWFERINESKLILMFVDSCFSGRAGGRTFEGPNLNAKRSSFRDVSPVKLSELDLGEGRLMIAACDDDQVAREMGELKHGVFTYYLLQKLQQPVSSEKTISLNGLYDDVAESVKKHTNGRQIPIINGRSRVARFPLLGK
jgi:uncharacterized caspase-like protein